MNTRPILIAATLLIAACRKNRLNEEVVIPPIDLVLEVSNNNWSDVIIYMVQNGTRKRFTIVTAAHSASIAIPGK